MTVQTGFFYKSGTCEKCGKTMLVEYTGSFEEERQSNPDFAQYKMPSHEDESGQECLGSGESPEMLHPNFGN